MPSHVTSMKLSESTYFRTTAREFAVLGVAALGAYLFFIHGSLYLQAGSTGRPLTLEGFLLVTTILYLFLRLLFVVAALYNPRPRTQVTICEQCGREIEGNPAEELARHGRVTLSHRPTEREVMAAIMLRKAIDEARRSAEKPLSGPRDAVVQLPGNIENLPVPPDEFERILYDLDHPGDTERPSDRRPRGPPGPPP